MSDNMPISNCKLKTHHKYLHTYSHVILSWIKMLIKRIRQWWSILRMHRLQTEQWWERGGLGEMHFLQMDTTWGTFWKRPEISHNHTIQSGFNLHLLYRLFQNVYMSKVAARKCCLSESCLTCKRWTQVQICFGSPVSLKVVVYELSCGFVLIPTPPYWSTMNETLKWLTPLLILL